ncbi:MAG: fumarylacetoacetate hydrolase family protein [Candidatus Dormibacteraeota bacterium]|uniref:Fumarylacetoacetate hydrolase family protein n=1 Tax=Candidatus Dormiibacter inghamiae TaxID=3127013 RepID=A0A934KF77_9BACT|nr:fumarylacetoacetate hydrolase family protein [Candidatus Dormibacteraeota bacterium]MBJ7607122.1 fumarylacetoacetate hydrolase family protein [Candidatus Dormibacteraeota bacterium]
MSVDMTPLVGLLGHLRPAISSWAAEGAPRMRISEVRLGPPVPAPRQIIAVGANYAGHMNEVSSSQPSPSRPVLFAKSPGSVVGPNDDIIRPPETRLLDYEAELAVVIGTGGRRVRYSDAMAHVAGFMIANDVTARDVVLEDQAKHPLFLQVLRGKGYDSFCPTGPWLVTPDDSADPHDMGLRLWVNGELRQDDTTAHMTYDVESLIESISASIRLFPGDIILTGTPAGVGMAMKPPRSLTAGDVVRIAIDSLGTMSTNVKDEDDPTAATLWEKRQQTDSFANRASHPGLAPMEPRDPSAPRRRWFPRT